MICFNAFMPVRIVVGKSKADEVGSYGRPFGSKALIVTGKGSMKASGYTDRIIHSLKAADIDADVFDQVTSNPERQMVNDAAAAAKRFGAEFVIGLGGGSAIDTAKGAAAVAGLGGDVWDYVSGQAVGPGVLPIVAIPSTAGTGSEVTQYTVITDRSVKRKNGFASEFIVPKVAIIDPELMSTVPPSLTAKAGGDVVAQAVEAYTTKLAHGYSDLLALESVRLCERYLRRAVQDGADLEARAAIGWASSLAGMAIAFVDVVIGHHASEAVGSVYPTHHGETAAALLVPTLRFNFEQTQSRLSEIATAMGRDVSSHDERAAAEIGIDAIHQLLSDIGIPDRLSKLGVGSDSIPQFIEILQERREDLEAGNPRDLDEQSMKEFFEMAI